MIVERNSEPTTHPQAHFINNRTMEVRGPIYDDNLYASCVYGTSVWSNRPTLAKKTAYKRNFR